MAFVFDVPNNSVSYAAKCTANFAEICRKSGLTPRLEHIKYEKRYNKRKKAFLWVGVRLDSDRFAGLYKEANEDYFRIYLQMIAGGFYLIDLDELRRFINVDKSFILRLDNDLRWIQPEQGRPIDLSIVKPAPGTEDGLLLLKKMWSDAGVEVDMDKLEADIRAERSKEKGEGVE